MKIFPLRDYVLIEPLLEDEKTMSGIFISRREDKKPTKGIVKAIGKGRIADTGNRIPVDEQIKVGDKILFMDFHPDIIKVEDKKIYLIREGYIIATYEEETPTE